MSDQSLSAIELAIQNLKSRTPKPKGRRQVLAPYVPALRELLAAGWSQAEIVAEIKGQGVQMSPALLRAVLQIDPAKPKKISSPGKARPRPSALSSQVSHSKAAAMPHSEEQQIAQLAPPAPTAAPSDYGQQSAQIAPPNGGQPAYDFDPE